MPQRSWSSIASTFATSTLVVCALVSTVALIGRTPPPTQKGFVRQSDWKKYNNDRLRLGPSDAKVTIIEFSDFQCPACKLFANRLAASRQKYGDKLAVIFRHLPLTIHAEAEPAAVASECAAAEGRFEQMHDVLFAKQDSLGIKSWESFAQDAAIANVAVFSECLARPETIARVSADAEVARTIGADRTPTVMIDGVRFSGAIPQRSLDSLIDNALARAR